MIKNLIFDFGKVLVDYDFEAFFRKYIPDDKRREAYTQVLIKEDIQAQVDRESIPFDEILDNAIGRNREFEYEIGIFKERYPELITNEIEGMKELITKLKAEGYKIYGLSNWCSKVYVTMAQFDIFDLLDGYVVSCEEKCVKPEPEIYHRLFSKFNLKPEECIFTDDREDNIEGGKQVGMNGIVFHDAKQYERELRAMLVDCRQ